MKIFTLSLLSIVWASTVMADINSDPWQLNVYTIQNIGKSNTGYGSDFQGTAGAGGDANFSGFSLNLLNSPANGPFSLYTGGAVNFINGTVSNGGIEAGSNIYLNGAAVFGNISGGGNLNGGSGTVHGNVKINGVKNAGPNLTITGSVQQGQPYTPTVNQSQVGQYFKNASQFWGGLAPTTTTTDQFGQIQVNGLTSGRNVVDLSLAMINNSWGIALNGPSDAFVVFNISDTTTPASDFMKALTFQLTGGIAFDDILFNVMNAGTLSLNGGTYASLLAPNSDVTFGSGLLTGNLVAQNLYGSGQVNIGSFTGFSQDQHHFVNTPEPATVLTLCSLCLVGMIITRKRQLVRPEVR